MRHLRAWCLLSCLLLFSSTLNAAAGQTQIYLPLATLQVPIRPGPPIAFVPYPPHAGNNDIYLIRPDRTGLTRLTLGDVAPFQLAWSPDARQIVFSVYGATAIKLLRLSDRRITTLISGNGAFSVEDPTWSPDGRQILFVKRPPNVESQIAVMQPDGTQVRILTNGDDPTWSPDGKEIAYVASLGNGNRAVFVMRADGTPLRQLTTEEPHPLALAWSPDGTQIAGWLNGKLMLLRSDGTGSTEWPVFTGSPFHRPAWSPDSTRIAYVNYYGGRQVYVVNMDGTGKYEVIAGADAPAWAPR